MRPPGLKPKRFPGKRDWHIRGFLNWWEAVVAKNGKARDRQEAIREIGKVIRSNSNEL